MGHLPLQCYRLVQPHTQPIDQTGGLIAPAVVGVVLPDGDVLVLVLGASLGLGPVTEELRKTVED